MAVPFQTSVNTLRGYYDVRCTSRVGPAVKALRSGRSTTMEGLMRSTPEADPSVDLSAGPGSTHDPLRYANALAVAAVAVLASFGLMSSGTHDVSTAVLTLGASAFGLRSG